jgi:glycerol-3-phosphate dehydrogenase
MTPSVRASLRDLAAARPDLLVIGGGITGAGIARDAALRGLDVVLVEARDFGEGTSSRSSRLIHGGLRYLEQGRLGLVAEALRERAVLLRLAPHLVRPLPFVLPVFRGDRLSRWKVTLGLSLYDMLAGTGNVRRHQSLGKRGVLRLEPLLRERGLMGGALFHDAQCDDARLTLAVVRAAAMRGARVANHMRMLDLLRDGGRITGARLRDELTGEEEDVGARLVVNATGPWSDTVRRLEDPAVRPILRATRGSHFMVPAARVGNRNAILFTSPVDGRVMFVLPWGEWSYVGTTDTDTDESPDQVRPEEADLVYLLRSANAIFPGAHLTPDDVVATWAGLRPLLAARPGLPAWAVSREHRILRGPGGMLTIAGGKLTTFRKMAAQVVDQAARALGAAAGRGRASSETEPLPGGEAAVTEGFRAPGLELGLPAATVDHLLRLYGGEAPALYTLCRERPGLAAPLHPEHPAIEAQVVFAVERELARRPEDVLARRIHLTTETRDHGARSAARVADLMAASLDSTR